MGSCGEETAGSVAVDVASMTDHHDDHDQDAVIDGVEDAVITHP